MLKPPHPVARAAYALAMKINPNNHALDGGRASSAMEVEAVREIAAMFGWKEFLGHLTSSGTFANLEALWIAGQIGAGRRIVGSEQAHYTHQRISGVLKLEYAGIATDERGRMSLEALEDELRKGDVGTVVATLGTTAMGAVDPLDEILALQGAVRIPGACGRGVWRLLRADFRVTGRAGAAGLRGDRAGRFDRDRSAQARLAAVWVRLRAVSRSGGGAASTNTIRRIRTSRRRNSTLARSAWSARARERRRWRCGPRSGCCRLCRAAICAGAGKGAARAAVELDRRLRGDARFVALAAGGPELDIVVWALRAATPEEASEQAQKVSMHARRAGCTWRS